jgi:hypothetical protein
VVGEDTKSSKPEVSKPLMIVDHAGGYVSTDHELQVKTLWENVKDESLRSGLEGANELRRKGFFEVVFQNVRSAEAQNV